MATVSKKRKPTANRHTRRALAKLVPVTTKFLPEELADIDYFVELVNQPGSAPEGKTEQRFSRNQVIRIATTKYMQGVLRKAKEMSEEYRKQQLHQQPQGEADGSSTGVAQADTESTSGSEDPSSPVLAEEASPPSEA